MKTKRIILLAVLALTIGASASAQDFRFGVKAGVAGNWVKRTLLTPGDRVVPNIGFYGGVAGNIELSDLMFAQAELLFARKGISTRNNVFGEYSRNISYIQLPLFVGFKLGEDVGLMLGPEFGVCVGNRVIKNEYDPSSIGTVCPFNLAIAGQINYMITDELGIDFKVDLGLTRTLKIPEFEGRTTDGNNLSVQVGMCYFF